MAFFLRSTGISGLEPAKTVLESLLRVDARGGFFTHGHMVAAVEAVWKGQQQNLEGTTEDCVELISYKLRVMLSHVRNVFDSCADRDQHKLNRLFGIRSSPPDPEAHKSDDRKIRRTGRALKRLSPFICYRGEGDDAVEKKLAVDDVTKATKLFNGTKVYILLSGGSTVYADKYWPTDEGLVVACWLGEWQDRMLLDIPNNRLNNGAITRVATGPVAKRTAAAAGQRVLLKRPAATAGTAMASNEVEAGPINHEDIKHEPMTTRRVARTCTLVCAH